MFKARGFILILVLLLQVLVTLLGLSIAQQALMHLKFQRQLAEDQMNGSMPLQGLLMQAQQLAQQTEINLKDNWQAISIKGDWPLDAHCFEKLIYLKFLPDSLAFADNRGSRVYQLTVRCSRVQQARQTWTASWWYRVQWPVTKTITVGGQWSSHDEELLTDSAIYQSYLLFQKQQSQQAPVLYQIENHSLLAERTDGALLAQYPLLLNEKHYHLCRVDIEKNGVWKTLLIVTADQHLWVMDIKAIPGHGKITCLWSTALPAGLLHDAKVFRASDGNWYVLLNVWQQNTKFIILNLLTGKTATILNFPQSVNDISAILFIDLHQAFQADWIYVTDGSGQIWPIDISHDSTAMWKIHSPIFTAKDLSGNVQKIGKMIAAEASGKGLYLYFSAQNSKNSSLYGLYLLTPVTKMGKPLIEQPWPERLAEKRALPVAWRMDVNDKRFLDIVVRGNALWWVASADKGYVGKLDRMTGLAPVNPVFTKTSAAISSFIPKNADWRLDFPDAHTLMIAGMVIPIYPSLYQQGLQGVHKN